MPLPPIVAFSSIDWDYVWQGHQEVMSRLAGAGHPVLFVENTGLRRPKLSDASRIWKRASVLAKTAGHVRQPVPGLQILSPRILPFPYSTAAVALNTRLLEAPIRRWLAGHAGRPLVWAYLPTPLVRSLAQRLSPALFVYHCGDDLPASSDLARPLAESENEVFRSADLVFVTSARLRQKALAYRADVHMMPPGVDYERFEAARVGPAPAPEEVQRLQRPVVGYIGGMHRWFDVPLMAAVVRSLPHVQFLFVGPVQVSIDPLASLPNAHFIGPRPHGDVPRYLRDLDVAIIPYVLDAYTESVYPTKLIEYLAMGLPVVSTPLAEVIAFRDRHGPVVEVAATAEAFTAALTRALEGASSQPAREVRYSVAKAQGWAARVAAMRDLVASTLVDKSAGPEHASPRGRATR